MSGYSLHIGLNLVDPAQYDGWDGQLYGCVNDANSMMALASAAGFQTRQMLDGAATSQAVIGALGELARQAVAGDICLITYSGHGGQVDDINGDEDEGQDETWVLFDRQVVDDELYQMYSQFAAGVRIVVLSDSCHSGTVSKFVLRTESRKALLGAVRSRSREAAPPVTVVQGPPRSMPTGVERADNERRRGTYRFVQSLAGAKGDADISAGVLLISGCQDNQLSYDGDVNGQFTGTLLQVWAGGAFAGDYVSFHRRIVDQMPPDQTPNLFTIGAVDAAFTGQKPFTLAAPAPGGASSGGGTGGARPTLRQGTSGDAVLVLQQRLTAHGYPVTADGFFGPATDGAVRSFQSAKGLAADGVVGAMTWSALDAAPAAGGGGSTGGWGSGSAGGSTGGSTGGWGSGGSGTGGSGTGTGTGTGTGAGTGTATGGWGTGTSTMTRPTIRRGDANEHVLYLQTRLSDLGYSLTPDGIFGPGTESMVKSFQRSNALSADGVVGPMTWEALG